jgi:protein-S-isoprenylcysteine O-methyltransferase Ste14
MTTLRATADKAAASAVGAEGASIARALIPILPLAILLLWKSLPAAAVYHVFSRLAYVGTAGVILRRRSLRGGPRRRRERDFLRFRRTASALMSNDAASFVALALLSAGSFRPTLPMPAVLAIAAALVALGIGVKAWAARTLPAGAYYWRDFFVRPEPGPARSTGPYRFLADPMYGVGYAHVYGLALGLLSWPGLLAALFDQGAILAFHALVERPHARSLYGARPAGGDAR